MEKVSAQTAKKELTMILLYLSRFTEDAHFFDGNDFQAWKGYDFGVLNELSSSEYIDQGLHPSRRKSVHITESGLAYVQKLLEKYHIESD